MMIADDRSNLRHCGVVMPFSSMIVMVLACWLTDGRVDYLRD
jgi:hypothetical protein